MIYMALAIKEGEVKLLTVLEVARFLRLSVGAVRNLIVKKEIPALRLGKQYRIPKHVIDNLLSPLMGEAPEDLGFGLWKGRRETKDSVKYVNRLRKREEEKPLELILRELGEWEKASSLTRIS